MSVNISTQIIHASYASVIREIDANANIYDNPNQQGTEYPAWFIVHRSPVEIQRDFGRRLNGNCYILTYQIDIWYMIQQNITRLFDQYTQIAEQLEFKLEYLPIFGSDAVVHVYDKSWSLELNALKYSTTLRLRVFVDKDFKPEPMQVIEDIRAFIKNQQPEFYTLSFTNTEHPDFTVELPNDIVSEANTIVKLPSVYAKEVIDDETWVPFAWDIGEFGQSVYMNENKVANLLWKVGEFVTLSFENVTYPQFDVELPDAMLVEKGSNVTLPSVYGEFEEDGTTYIPENWDIGGFCESVTLELDTTAILLWRTVEPVGPVYPQGQFTYGEMQTNPNKQVELNAIPFDADEDKLMTATGNARDFINLEFIPDAGFEFIMGLNGLMEIWTGSTNPIAYFNANKSSVNLMSGLVYNLYDANGDYIPSDTAKTYTPIRLIDSNGQTIENSLDLSIRTESVHLSILTWPSFTSASGVVAIEYKVE